MSSLLNRGAQSILYQNQETRQNPPCAIDSAIERRSIILFSWKSKQTEVHYRTLIAFAPSRSTSRSFLTLAPFVRLSPVNKPPILHIAEIESASCKPHVRPNSGRSAEKFQSFKFRTQNVYLERRASLRRPHPNSIVGTALTWSPRYNCPTLLFL